MGTIHTTLSARNKNILLRLRAGETLQAVGDRLGLSRQRVEQIAKSYGYTHGAEGAILRVLKQQQSKLGAKDAKSLQRWGLSHTEYYELQRSPGRPTYAFQAQRKNARRRKILWNLTLAEWWRVWDCSGKWTQRGRGSGYVMSRIGDVGPYAVENVFIQSSRDNSREGLNKHLLPMGVSLSSRGRFKVTVMREGKRHYLGVFATATEASRIYEEFVKNATAA